MPVPAPLQTLSVGDVEITFLPDGEGHFDPTGMFPTSTPEAWQEHVRWLDGDGRYLVSIGAFLVRSGGRAVVVDLGLGPEVDMEVPGFATATSGRLLESLGRAGLTASEVDTVLFTHLHSDHTGWTSGPGGLTFPNAEYLAGETEFEFWRGHQDLPFAPAPEAVLDPLQDRITAIADGHAVAPGVTVRSTPGHTPGHQTVVVSSGSQRAIILGDVMHCPVQVATPEWGVLFDVDADLARRTRENLLAELEGTDVPVACGHFPDAVFGRVLAGQGKRYWQVG